MPNNRPTSPHLTIYRPQMSSVTSITHRFTGVALVAGLALVTAWLCASAYAPGFYSVLYDVLNSVPGQLCLIGWTLSLYYHLANGIRHLFWDIGQGFTIPVSIRSGWAVILFTLAMTAFTWGYVYSMTGHGS